MVAHSPKFAIRDFSGEVELSPGALDKASVRLSIQIASFDILDDVSKADRREIERMNV